MQDDLKLWSGRWWNQRDSFRSKAMYFSSSLRWDWIWDSIFWYLYLSAALFGPVGNTFFKRFQHNSFQILIFGLEVVFLVCRWLGLIFICRWGFCYFLVQFCNIQWKESSLSLGKLKMFKMAEMFVVWLWEREKLPINGSCKKNKN